jgi:hypothetical protein
MSRTTRAAAYLLAALGWSGSLRAQGPPSAGEAGGPRPREEVFKVVDAYFLSNLQESLGLTDDQYVKLLPLVQKLHRDRREFMQRRGRTTMELRTRLKAGQATEASIQDLLAELKQVESDMWPALARAQQAIDAQLSPLQQAKYRVLESEVEQKLRELMGRGRSGGDRTRRLERPGEGPRRPRGD